MEDFITVFCKNKRIASVLWHCTSNSLTLENKQNGACHFRHTDEFGLDHFFNSI